MLNNYPEKEDWYRVRFSDEVHFGCSSKGKLPIIRKPGQRYCQDCVQEEHMPDEKNKKRHNDWAAAGPDLKSFIHFYDVSGNKNGKMSQRVYIDQILDTIVKPWLDQGHNFVLEEDSDSRRELGKSNIVRWKEEHRLEIYFNCLSSSDLSPIENC